MYKSVGIFLPIFLLKFVCTFVPSETKANKDKHEVFHACVRLIITTMVGIGTLYHLGEAVVGVCTANPVLIADGLIGAGKSYVMGEIMSPITEPIKDAIGDFYSDVDWVDVIDTCPSW